MSISHLATRKAFESAIDGVMKYISKDRQSALLKLVDISERYLGDTFGDKVYNNAREEINNPNSKWIAYINKLLDELDPRVFKTTALNLGFEAGFYGYKKTKEIARKYDCNIPWIILMDPTSACNLNCTGCWAAEYGNRLNLSFDDLDSIVSQGKDLGIYFYMMTGGEPLVRKDDILRLCEKHKDCAFHAFTNGTLIDEELCKKMVKLGNLSLSISLEGFREVNDERRGEGIFNKVMESMDLLKKYGLLFGASICYTSKNVETVTSDEFLDLIINKGCLYTWYFHYMPVGNEAATELIPTISQREYIYKRIREIRSSENNRLIFPIDFQNDGEFVTGCIAGGRCYCHINPNGDVEPCVFIHYSNANIKEKSLLECLRQPLFLEYKKGQPFNDNHLMPCPMLENPNKLIDMVKRTKAKSTDLKAPESPYDLCGKCSVYSKEWEEVAKKLWKERGIYNEEGL